MTMMFKLCGGRCEVPTRVNPKVSRQTIHHHTFTHILLLIITHILLIIITHILLIIITHILLIILIMVGWDIAALLLVFTVTVLIILHMMIGFGYVSGLQGGSVGYLYLFISIFIYVSFIYIIFLYL